MTMLSLPPQSKMLTRDFTFGVATASFQIEGGADQRLPCIWDTFCNTDGKIADNSNGLQACQHYSRWQDDVELIAALNVDAYRLSISWPRVINKDGELNPTGVEFYLNLLQGLQAKNIKTFVTLYHWDLPQHLEDKGGWLNRQTAYEYARYVEKIVPILRPFVHSFATFNEPFCSAYLGYEAGIHAPGLTGIANGRQASHHILLAHGLGMQQLQQLSPDTLNGIVLNFTPCYPASQAQTDIAAANYADDYFNQWYIKPLFDAAYPEIISSLADDCRPDIHDGDMQIIAQPLDFLGVNFYTRAIYRAGQALPYEQLPPPEPRTDIGWEIYPQAFTDLLVDLNSRYALPPIYITENGAAMADSLDNNEVNDQDRVNYYQQHLTALDHAINRGVDVQGYFAWSLMDNFEWAEGYSKRFGLVYVDYQTQKRTIKASGLAFSQLIQDRNNRDQ